MGELFKVKLDGSAGRLVAGVTLTMSGAHGFSRVGPRGLENPDIFFRFPSEIEHPNLLVQPLQNYGRMV